MITPKNKLLMVALEYPPCRSAGVERTLRFSQYLPEHNWQPIVITAKPNIYRQTDFDQTIPAHIEPYIRRAWVTDIARSLSFHGKHFAWTKIPDRWWSWAFDAIRQGKHSIKQHQPSAIWSTFPVTTAHFIAYRLSRWSNLPWIADFRDPMPFRYDCSAQKNSTAARWIEEQTIRHCSKAVFTATHAEEFYRDLYPNENTNKFVTIENGYNESNFENIDLNPEKPPGCFRLLHSGSIYGNGRDPEPLFAALAELKSKGVISHQTFQLVFRGSGCDADYDADLKRYDIHDVVEFLPSVALKQSVEEVCNADALLLLQGALFRHQIPGKVYQYIRAGRPILAATSPGGATDTLLSPITNAHVSYNQDDIERDLTALLSRKIIHPESPEAYTRKRRTEELAQLLEQIIGPGYNR